MSQWANSHPEEWEAIASLPPSEQNGALRAAMSAYAYDPDRVLDRLEELELETPSAGGDGGTSAPPHDGSGSTSPAVDPYEPADHHCDVCGAPPGKHHLSYCDLRGDM